ncbi:piwi-like protein 1 isoform X2 [Diadema setosum]|uniref:piwi-like protein 1 isoform X2 n=1 Tax=Diadema setosum TaxID=31175 RepID=UPI003B3B1168
MSQPTGRARGRARGRGRASAPPAGAAAPAERRPGEQRPREPPSVPQDAGGMPVPGRGRSRGGTTQPGPGAAPPQQPREDLSGQMAKMHIGAAGEGGVGGAVPDRRRRREEPIIEPVTRPEGLDKKATSGQQIQLVANCFKLVNRPNWQLYQYRVDFEPEILNPRARFALLRAHSELLGANNTLDMDTMYSMVKLPEKVTNLVSTRKDGSAVNIKCTLVATLNPMAPNTLHLYGVLFRKVLKMIKMEQIGRHFYDSSSPIEIRQHGLKLWPGFTTSITQFEYDVMLMADISHKVLRTHTVLDVMYQLYERTRGNFKEEITRQLVGQIVLTKYNNKTYRVDDIDFDTHPSDTFDTRSGPVSFQEYFQKSYECKLEDPDQPMLVSRPKKREEKKGMGPILLPPELCYMTGLTDDMRANFQVMKDLAQFTRVAPRGRCEELTTFNKRISGNPEVTPFLEGWGLKFDKELVKLPGRVLAPEKIFQVNKQFSYNPSNADWSRETRGNQLTNSIPLQSWVIFYTSRDANRGNDFIGALQRVGGPMGMNVAQPKKVVLKDDRAETYVRSLQDNIADDTQIVVVILPTNRKDRYDAIKKMCIVTRPCPSQVIVTRTISKQQMLMSVATKIAMQLNCKMGGDLWRVEIPLSKLMIIGIDSFHEGAGARSKRSVCGFVATMNNYQTRYFSQCSFQPAGSEHGDAFVTLMTNALKRYHTLNSFLPDRVIVFRDGVGDSQLTTVVNYEVSQIRQAMSKVYPETAPQKLAVVVVKKRINNRFFLNDRGNLGNPPPGTVIDDVVTRPMWYDYFIISQSVRQGTVSPTSYNVVYDTTNLRPDHMQRLTYKLTHLYFNWPGTVRVPAPCMYAHKLAFLIGQSVHQEHHPMLSDTLFYL